MTAAWPPRRHRPAPHALSPATKGDVGEGSGEVDSLSGTVTLVSTVALTPDTDAAATLGTPTKRLAAVHAAVVHTGDLVMRCDERNAHWRLVEHARHIEVINLNTGERFRLGLVPDSANPGRSPGPSSSSRWRSLVSRIRRRLSRWHRSPS